MDRTVQLEALQKRLTLSPEEGEAAAPQLAYLLDYVQGMTLAYCGLDALPPALAPVVVELAAKLFRAEKGEVTSLAEGDVKVTFAGASHPFQDPGVREQLVRYRRLSW